MREWAKNNHEIYIVTGPALKGKRHKRIGKNKVAVPQYYYKVVLDCREPDLKAIGFILKHEGSDKPLRSFAVTVNAVEHVTGFDFFPDLPDEVEERLESGLDLDKWSWRVERSASSGNSGKRRSKNLFNIKLTKRNIKKLMYWIGFIFVLIVGGIGVFRKKTKKKSKTKRKRR